MVLFELSFYLFIYFFFKLSYFDQIIILSFNYAHYLWAFKVFFF